MTLRCSDAARQRNDPLAGTAPRPARWLLVEHPGPWAVDAVLGSGIAPGVLERLGAAASGAGARILLIRRPGRRTAAPRRAWAVVDSEPGGGATWGGWSRDEELLPAADLLASRAPLARPADLVLLVCAHGRHDTCCAVRGRPVAAALAARWPEATWECSHVGGDRFAANVVVLPDGWYYGGLDGGDGVEVVRRHLAGQVVTDRLRGMTTEPPAAQAAVVAVMDRHGHGRPGSVRSTGIRALAPARWLVDVATPAGPVVAVVAGFRAEAARLTCRAVAASAAVRYVVERIDPTTGAGPVPG